MPMRRRRFLGVSAAGLVTASWPGLIRAAFASTLEPSCPKDTSDDSTSSCEAVVAAYRQARAAGRPLLVLTIPKASQNRYVRGELLGALINGGDDATLAAFGLCEVVCATVEHAKVLPALATFSGPEPLALVVETSDAASTYGAVPAHKAELDVYSSARSNGSLDAAFDRAFTSAGAALRAGIGALPARAARLRSSAEVVVLAREARSRLKDQRVPGSKWARGGGCGATVERLPGDPADDQAMVVGCGMGYVPAKAARMLYFYADRRRT